MDQAGISRKVNRGYGIAARFLGNPFTQYRPVDPLAPLNNPLGSLMADFDTNPGFTYAAPSKFNNPVYYGLFDATNVQTNDYLIADRGTWYVAGMEPNKPVLCVGCNRTATFWHLGPSPPSPAFYGGDIQRDRVRIMVDIPISELNGTKGERNAAEQMPTDSRMQWSQVLVPALPGVTLRESDRMTDDLGRNFVLSACELTSLGWRLSAELVEA